MKKIFTLLSIAALSTAFGQKAQVSVNQSSFPVQPVENTNQNRNSEEYTLIQYSSNVPRTNMVACTGTAGTVNHFSRLFDLAAEGINTEFTVTSVSVMGSGQEAGGAILELAFSEIDQNAEYNGDNVEAGLGEGYGFYSFPYGEQVFPDIELLLPQTVAPGKKLAVALATTLGAADGSFNQGVFLGNNDLPQSAPSYIGWPGSECVSDDPTDITTLGFTQSMIFHVTGETVLGTVELGSNKLSVYPNPATSEVNVTLKDSKVASVEIADVTGRVVSSQSVKNGKVNVANLSSGVYFLRVKDDKGVIRINKFIKK